MPEPFLVTANVTNAIKNILEHYPLVDGPIRELLQNSDDARATKQIFILDRRHHPITSLVSPEYLAAQQYPALIAYNDAYFKPRDWDSLKSLFDSSKSEDPETLGQFGQGFRCVYHLTDCPQIFSATTLAFLNLPEGKTIDTRNSSDAKYVSHIAAFQGLPNVPCESPSTQTPGVHDKGKGKQSCPHLDGTAIRLPLRSRASPLSTKCSKVEDILKLFEEFSRHDLECVLLFLKHVKEIEVYEVTPEGRVREICSATLRREHDTGDDGKSAQIQGGNYTSWRAVVETKVQSSITPSQGLRSASIPAANTVKTTITTWRFLNCPFTDTSSTQILRQQLSKEHNPEEEMKRRKLHPRIQVAAPLSITVSVLSMASASSNQTSSKPQSHDVISTVPTHGINNWRSGRVFSGLPLPRANNRKWPIHVDACFAIPPSRQWIRSTLEGGFIGEWNSMLFAAFIPQAWTFLLNILARMDEVKDIFEYWPPPGAMNDFIAPASTNFTGHGGLTFGTNGSSSIKSTNGPTRSQGMLQIVFDCVVVAQAVVWPVYTPFYPPLPMPPPRLPTKPSGKSLSTGSGPLTPQPPAPATPPTTISPPTPTTFAELGNLKVAREDAHFLDLRNTLAEFGIKFTKPPTHFNALIQGCTARKCEFLEQKNVYEDLLNNVSRLEKVVSETDKHATVLLDFLIQSQDIHLLIGLPLLKNIEGYYVTLKRLDSSNSPTAVKQTIHPMFEAQSAQLFKEYDPQAISLHELKHSHATYIRNNAPGFLNVIDLTAEKVAEYLSTDPRWTTPLLTTTSSIITSPSIPFEISQWLSKFYTWLSSQPFVDTFFHLPGIQQLYLVPTQLGLRRVGDVTFDNVTPALGKCLRALGICVLDAVAGPTPRKLLVNASVLKKAEDIHLIIDCANNGVSSTGISSTSLGLTCVEWRVLIDHIVRYMTTEELHPDEARKLRSLPIYPILPADSLNAIPTPSPGAIPENKFVYAVTSVEILPVIDACVLLDFRELRSYDILRFLDPKSPPDDRPLTPVQVFELVVQNFGSQTPEIRSSIVRFGAKNEKIIPRDSLEKLLEMPSIVCRDDQARKPEDVVDPTSKIDLAQHVVMCSRLSGSESTFDGYLPRSDSQTDREIVEGFRGLRSSPFKQHLDQALLIKMTSCISRNADQPESIVISKKLFKVLASNPTYADFVRAIPHEDKWIATNSGLRAQHACRDRDADWDIFDDVYAVVDDDITVPHALRGALGWLEEISLDALFSRLDVTLKKAGDFSRVRDVVKRIGSIAGVSDPDLDQLRLLLGDRSWVPTRAGKLVRPEDAVLDHAIDEAGIFEVSFNQAAYPEVIEFLKRMGVRDRPTTTIILARIREKAPGPLIGDEVTTTMKLLSSLVEDLSPEFKAQVLVPDVDGLMRRVSELYFNDTGISISIPDSPHTQRAIAHFLLPEALARKLGIEPLAKSYSRFSGYMGESFLSSIRSVMRDYTETQTLVEMLANAADAGAKRFIVIVDEMRQSAQISSKLRVFQESAALLVYNDAKFTNRDFEGLCNTGEGSKRDQGDSIGQFGRGALTMFHFTEFPILMSSTTAMFINPSRMHLPDLPPHANNQRMDMATLHQFYPGHLSFLTTQVAELLNYDPNDFASFGTVFRLPLRSASHVDHDTPISTALWSARDIQDKILPAFHGIARDCLLFTGLECIQAHIRTQEGILQPLWSFEAERGDMPETIDRGTFQCGMVTITEDQSQPQLWQTVSYVVPDDAIPEDLSSLDKAHGRRLKHPKVSLAAFIRPPGAGYLDYHQKGVFFSTLPLTEETGLPVHCSGTFITTSDRRHIRLQLENDTSLQSRYNEWLLKDVIPPAYLTLLEWLLINGVPNHHFWPVNARVPADRILIPSLYENHLRNTDKNLFEGRFSPHKYLKPDEVVILGEGSDIQNIIEFLSPPNVAVYAEPFLSCVTDDAQLPPVSPRFVRDQILFDAARFLSAFSPSPTGEQSQLSIDDLINLLDFFLDHDADQLVELPLLPLEDGSFGAFARDPSQSTSYIWKYQSVPYQMFANPRHLVKLDFNAGILLNKGFNVEELCSSSLASLIEELFPKQSSINVSEHPGAQEFIDHFWASYPVLRLDFEDMKEFPLVPTLSPGQYISLSVCKNGDISIVPGRVDESACQCLATLGIPLVQISSPRFPRPLSNILINHKFNMKDILKSLQQTDLQRLIDGFSHLLSDERRADFSDWIRRQLFLDVPPELLETARALPVWQGHDRAGLHLYVPASELVLFPESLDHNIVAPYTTQYKIAVIAQGQNDILRPTLERRLGVRSMSFRHLLRDISSGLPASMPEAATRLSYRQLVEAVVERGGNPQEALTELKLPDAFDFTLRPVGDFYSREESETLFRNAFPQHSLKFVSREFQHMEGRLGPLRRTQDLTMEIFAECVEHIANINNPEGGTVAFDVMNDRLPVILGNLGPDAHRWSLIEEVEFIPKMTEPLERWNTPVNVSGYIQPQFDDLVAPQVILRAEFAAVAWSQRVTPERNLSEGLVRAYMGLGRPTVAEVMAHLRVLVTQVARDYPNHPGVLSDIVATYQYLNERAEDAKAQLAQLRDEPLFLNVDRPEEDGVMWQSHWNSASTISFDVRDVRGFKFARIFLQRFRLLLVAAGAQEVNGLSTQQVARTDAYARVRGKYLQMRRARLLVDVVFVPLRDDDPDNLLFGHRSFIATQSNHLMSAFTSGFNESGSASAENPVKVEAHYSRLCVSLVVDFMYTDIVESTSLEVLLEALGLARYWEMEELVEVLQEHIAGGWLHPDTLAQIENVATEGQFNILIRKCQVYRRDNAEYINRSGQS